MTDTKGKAAFITGGASGIGFGVAKAFAKDGIKVAIADIRLEAAQAAAKQINDSGGQAIAVKLDVGDRADWKRAADEAEAKLGPISILINNAGIPGAQAVVEVKTLDEMMPEEWDLLMKVNFTGQFNGIQCFVPRFKKRGGEAHVVNTVSMAGIMPQFAGLPPAYVCSKFGASGLTEQLRLELMDAFPQIQVSMLAPGTVATDIRKNTVEITSYAKDIVPKDMVDPMVEIMAKTMPPAKVGEAVLKAVKANQFYILTHPEYKAMSDYYRDRIAKSWGEAAAPGYEDALPPPR
jgi:NAD(P)-dependent dehydrogenase (short-subunit alcohol dehydrogenase family)